jgi:hypothetical protein
MRIGAMNSFGDAREIQVAASSIACILFPLPMGKKVISIIRQALLEPTLEEFWLFGVREANLRYRRKIVVQGRGAALDSTEYEQVWQELTDRLVLGVH